MKHFGENKFTIEETKFKQMYFSGYFSVVV